MSTSRTICATNCRYRLSLVTVSAEIRSSIKPLFPLQAGNQQLVNNVLIPELMPISKPPFAFINGNLSNNGPTIATYYAKLYI